jgi:hypothetical protein
MRDDGPARRISEVLVFDAAPTPPHKVATGSRRDGHVWIEVHHDDLPFRTLLRMQRRADEIVCTGIHIELESPSTVSSRTAIESRDLRKLPLASMAWHLASHDALRPVTRPSKAPPIERRRGRVGYGDAHHRRVLDDYLAARAERPHAPIKRLTEHYESTVEPPPSEATVRRWVRRARKWEAEQSKARRGAR